jgi:hypothetical protein
MMLKSNSNQLNQIWNQNKKKKVWFLSVTNYEYICIYKDIEENNDLEIAAENQDIE